MDTILGSVPVEGDAAESDSVVEALMGNGVRSTQREVQVGTPNLQEDRAHPTSIACSVGKPPSVERPSLSGKCTKLGCANTFRLLCNKVAGEIEPCTATEYVGEIPSYRIEAIDVERSVRAPRDDVPLRGESTG